MPAAGGRRTWPRCSGTPVPLNGLHGGERVSFPAWRGVVYDVRNPDGKPLTKDEPWDRMALPDGRLRTPRTVVGENVVLGYDPVKLEQHFGSRAANKPLGGAGLAPSRRRP